MSKTITVKCSAASQLPIDMILEFQGKLKTVSKENLNKLKNNILKNGFVAPIFVWDDSGDNKILDGHGRLKALLSLRQEGYDIPLLPVDYIHAEDEAAARKYLLSITGQYGEFDLDELNEWVSGLDSDIAETLRIVDANLGVSEDVDIIFSDDVEASASGGNSPTPTLSFWIFDYKFATRSREIYDYVMAEMENIKKLDPEKLSAAIVEKIGELLSIQHG